MVEELKKNGVEIVCKEEAVACKPDNMLALAGDAEKRTNTYVRISVLWVYVCSGDPPPTEYDAERKSLV